MHLLCLINFNYLKLLANLTAEKVVEEKFAEAVEVIEDNIHDVIITEEANESVLEVIEEKIEENNEATATG